MKTMLLRSIGTGLLLAAFGAASALGQTLATLETGAGDGQVIVDVDGYGSFGYQTFSEIAGVCDEGDALYDPVGPAPVQACTDDLGSTTWESAVYYRRPTVSTYLTTGLVGEGVESGELSDPGFDPTPSAVSATSSFTFDGLDFNLVQSVQNVFDGEDLVGSVLIQEYTITNPGSDPVSFDLVRYYEGDLTLGFGAGVPDGGGHIFIGDEEFVFETDVAGEPEISTDLVGITACGGTEPESGRFEVNEWDDFPIRITNDQPLTDVVFRDFNEDGFVDVDEDYDVGIALANEFDLDPGESATYVTTTVFGTLAPVDASGGCQEIIGDNDVEVAIDIKPGSDPNSINTKSRGKIPVAILSTDDFNAPSEVDRTSLTFGRIGDEDSLAFCTASDEDVSGDGLDDVVCHFNTQDTGFQCGDTEGILGGTLLDATPIEGMDSVKIVPCK